MRPSAAEGGGRPMGRKIRNFSKHSTGCHPQALKAKSLGPPGDGTGPLMFCLKTYIWSSPRRRAESLGPTRGVGRAPGHN